MSYPSSLLLCTDIVFFLRCFSMVEEAPATATSGLMVKG